MNKDEFAEVRRLCPMPPPPSDEVVQRAKECLLTTITEERAAQTGPTDPIPSRRRRRIPALIAAASVVAAAAIGVPLIVGHPGAQPNPARQISSSDSPVGALAHAAQLVADNDASGETGSIRYIRFRNLTDSGHPVYERYVRPDGTALVGKPGGSLEKSGGYLTSAQLASLPSAPAELRPAMQHVAKQQGLGFPGEAPERAIFRLAIDLLTDPGVTPQVKAGVYLVIAGFDLNAVTTQNLGQVTDPTGRPGIGLSFRFQEGAVEKLVLNPKTGAVMSDTTVLGDGTVLGGQIYLDEQLLDQVACPRAVGPV